MWSRFINKTYFQFTHSFAGKVSFYLFYCNICVSYYCVWKFCVWRGPFKWLVLHTYSVAIWHLQRPNQPTLPKIKWFGHLVIWSFFWPFSDFEENSIFLGPIWQIFHKKTIIPKFIGHIFSEAAYDQIWAFLFFRSGNPANIRFCSKDEERDIFPMSKRRWK